MIVTAPPLPMLGTMAGFRRFTVNEYHWLISSGFLTEDDDLELIEGYLVHKMARNLQHDRTIQRSNRKLLTTLPGGWDLRIQSAITLIESEPEPDISVVRGDDSMYDRNHPTPPNIGAVMEIADSSLPGDRTDKGRIYARAGIPLFWIIKLIDRQIEVYEEPSGPTALPGYAKTTIYKPGDTIPLTLDGTVVATFALDDLMP
ncbi:MAG: Uma2 family endonuclease [Gemmataceae bacterium]|nr:Uma2 family endonuclease [Gemmataceae bacterium]